MGKRKIYIVQDESMLRLRIKELAEARGWNISRLQIESRLSMGTIRRYWYSTADGSDDGEKLKRIDFDILEAIAKAMGIRSIDLIEEATVTTLESQQ